MVILIPAALGDYQRQKVPNWLSMSGWVAGPVLALALTGPQGFYHAVLGVGFMVLILVPLWMLGWFGAADVKLMGTVGGLTGLAAAPKILLGVLLAGMVFSLLVIGIRRLKRTHANQRITCGDCPEHEGSGTRKIVIPYAIPIAFGTLITILYMQL